MPRFTDSPHRLGTRTTALADTHPSVVDGFAVPVECQIARASGLNLLLIGAHRRTEQVLRALVPEEGTAIWEPGTPLMLTEHIDTLVLRDVDQLPLDDQYRLALWLEHRATEVHVVSTASAPLVAKVEGGRFRDDLYYRLNAIYVRC
jgi:transcriptional regulator of acetoin/glycerol metabolism